MSNTDQAPEPTMDEILASIRRIISDEPTEQKKSGDGNDSVADDIARALSLDDAGDDAGVTGLDDDILELTEVVSRDNPGPDTFHSATPQIADNVGIQAAASAEVPDPFGGLQAVGQNLEPAAGIDTAIMEPAAQQDISVSGLDPSVFEDEALFADENSAVASQISNSQETDQSIDFQQESGGDLPEATEFATGDGLGIEEVSGPGDSALSEEAAPELGEALSWDSLEEEFGQDGGAAAQSDAIRQVDVSSTGQEPDVNSQEGLSEAVKSLHTAPVAGTDAVEQSTAALEKALTEDQSVTFGEFSPEENLESALEQAISDIEGDSLDPHESWADEEQGHEQVATKETEQAALEKAGVEETTASDHIGDVEPDTAEVQEAVQKEHIEPDMTLSEQEALNHEASVQNSVGQEISSKDLDEKDSGEDMGNNMASAPQANVMKELDNALAAAQKVEAAEAQNTETTNIVATPAVPQQQQQPEVSEVIPVQQSATSALQAAAPQAVNPLEESIKDMLKPMLKEWLDENMPRLLQGVMKDQKLTKD